MSDYELDKEYNVASSKRTITQAANRKLIGIWVCGCPHHCDGCANPELWEFSEDKRISVKHLSELVKQIAEANPIDGFTITGGEPFYQIE